MLTYLLKRLLAMIPTLLGITFVTFLIVNLAPGDPVANSLGGGGDGGPTESGGGADRDRLADTIRAKKKLLGMVREDHSVHRLGLDLEATESGPSPLAVDERLGELSGWARVLALSPDGATVFVGGDQGLLVALDAQSGELVRRFEGHTVAVWAVAVSKDGATLVSGDTDGVLRGWDAGSGEARGEALPLGRPVRDLVFLDKEVLSASDDGKVRRHALPDLRETATLEGHVSSVYTIAASADGTRLYSGGYDRKLLEWDLGTNQQTRSWTVHPQSINDMALSQDGKRLATACDDRVARVIDLSDETAPPIEIAGHYKPVTAVAWVAEGTRLLTGSKDETLRLWDVAGAAELGRSVETSGVVASLALAPDGSALSVGETWVTVPIPVRYVKWLVRIATFDFDRSFVDERPVIEKIGEALPVTMALNVIALLLIYGISVPIGVLSAIKRGSTFDHVTSLLVFMLYSMPNFFLATLLIMSFSSVKTWDLLPSVGLISDNANDLSFLQWVWDGALHMVLPMIVLVYAGFASLSRYVRTSLLETIQEDYVRTARAKGLDEWTVVIKHAFRNSLITIVTLVANLLPAMIGGSIVVEQIFTIPGMGRLGFEAILTRDYPVIMAITTFSAFLTLLGILLSDLLYGVVDPRIRVE